MDDGPLCCCEYFDINQERNHILACCCNCQDLDEGFESLITGKGIPSHRKSAFMATLQDRIRIPWRGGAKRISFDAILPIFTIPLLLLLASFSLWWTLFSFTTMTVFLACISCQFMRCIPETKFFFVWSITSLIFLYGVFEFIVIPFLQILIEENIALSILITAFVFCLYMLKFRNISLCHGNEAENGLISKTVTNRGANCCICKAYIPDKDHHCVWFDCCIGSHNQCYFILALIFAEAALLYSSNLTLTSVCHPVVFYKTILIPDDCSEVYEQFELGLSFVSAVYSIGVAIVVLIILLHQMLLVSLGITGHEWRKIPLSKKLFCGITAHRPYSKGFLCNWLRIIQCSQRQY